MWNQVYQLLFRLSFGILLGSGSQENSAEQSGQAQTQPQGSTNQNNNNNLPKQETSEPKQLVREESSDSKEQPIEQEITKEQPVKIIKTVKAPE